MPDRRKHRGPHPEDHNLFGTKEWTKLKTAVHDLSWLLSRDYPDPAALKLVGDRFQLRDRQRLAVMRSSCSNESLQSRQRKCIEGESLPDAVIHVDAFNLLTTIEAMLSGGVLLLGRDGCIRDMASMHGSYRRVEETRPALVLIGNHLSQLGVIQTNWYLDRPVSNSGRLSQLMRDVAAEHGWDWHTALENNPDTVLSKLDGIIVSADSQILEQCRSWLNLARQIVELNMSETIVVPLNGELAP